jgi:hypothetical protein
MGVESGGDAVWGEEGGFSVFLLCVCVCVFPQKREEWVTNGGRNKKVTNGIIGS